MKQTIEYQDYKIEILQDECAENPFTEWNDNPPLLGFYGGRHGDLSTYGAPDTLAGIVRLMPEGCFNRGQRVALVKKHLDCSLREFAEARRDDGTDTRDTFAALAADQVGSKPEGWRSACEWFELAESLLQWAGLPCLYTQSNGYCQGDTILLLAIATPEFLTEVGVAPQHVTECLRGAVELYAAWAWGDVYGVSSITGPDGEEIEGGSCWGFYGKDLEKNGLMDHARGEIDYHIQAKVETALNEPACLI